MKKKLWVRKLDCGHERLTNLAYLTGNYNKPKIGDKCYCRVCWDDKKVVEVKESTEEELKNIEKIKKEIKNE